MGWKLSKKDLVQFMNIKKNQDHRKVMKNQSPHQISKQCWDVACFEMHEHADGGAKHHGLSCLANYAILSQKALSKYAVIAPQTASTWRQNCPHPSYE